MRRRTVSDAAQWIRKRRQSDLQKELLPASARVWRCLANGSLQCAISYYLSNLSLLVVLVMLVLLVLLFMLVMPCHRVLAATSLTPAPAASFAASAKKSWYDPVCLGPSRAPFCIADIVARTLTLVRHAVWAHAGAPMFGLWLGSSSRLRPGVWPTPVAAAA